MLKYLVLEINNNKKQFPQDIFSLRHPPPPITSSTVSFDIILSLYMFANHVRYNMAIVIAISH